MKRFSRTAILLAGLSLASGCAYVDGDIGNPIHRKFHWQSFVAGDDIAASCSSGNPDRVRLVYNAIWDKQVRIYEIDSIKRSLRVRVFGQGNLTDVKLTDPIAPWRADETKAQLDEAGYEQLAATLAESGAFGPPAVGLELPSHSYYWTAATCRQGKFTFTGWAYPSAAFDASRIPAALFALDPGRDGVVAPGPIPYDVMWEYRRKQGQVTDFTFKVGANGMVR